MKIKESLLVIPFLLLTALCNAQDTLVQNTQTNTDKLKVIPDKVFEFGLPMLFLIILLSIIVTVLKNRADHQLKLKLIEKGVADETLIQIFKESTTILKLQPLKYFFLFASLSISFFIIHFTYEERDISANQSGYYSLGVIFLLTSIAFIVYYKILQRKL
jgi:hypothetical protein